jgi:hypothetical protein
MRTKAVVRNTDARRDKTMRSLNQFPIKRAREATE